MALTVDCQVESGETYRTGHCRCYSSASALPSRSTEGEVFSLNLLRAVLLIIALAPLTLQAAQDLCSHSDPLANTELLDGIPDMGDLADDLVSGNTPLDGHGTPSAGDGVDVRAAYTAEVDGDGDVVRARSLQFVGIDGEVGVFLGILIRSQQDPTSL